MGEAVSLSESLVWTREVLVQWRSGHAAIGS
jgi:hypothetical protein